jgi:2'-5' RNA ligase
MNENPELEKRIKLFIGIELPKEIKLQIGDFLEPIHQLPKGWVNPLDYHQTLLFIGSTPISKLEEIKNRLDQISFHSFMLETSDFKFLPRRIMYLDFRPSLELFILTARVQELFPEYVRENEKDFLPHITVKRWQRYEYSGLVRGLEGTKFMPLSFLVSSIALFKSERDSKNVNYHVIHKKKLKHP